MEPTSFGEKTAWWAFKTGDADSVVKFLVDELSLRDVRTASWDEGVEESYDTSDPDHANVLVTPAIDGYVLATTCHWLRWWSEDLEVTSRASEWVDRLGIEIQYFASDRITGLEGWGKVNEDFEERAFVKRSSEILHHSGAITDGERDAVDSVARDCVSYGFLDAASLAQRVDETRLELLASIEAARIRLADGSIMRGRLEIHPDDATTIAALCVSVEPGHVAARWSVDPNVLDERPDASTIPATCWVGKMFFP